MAQEPTSAVEYWLGVEAIRNRQAQQKESKIYPASDNPSKSVPLAPLDAQDLPGG